MSEQRIEFSKEKKTERAGKQEKTPRNHSKGAHTAVTRRQESSAVLTSKYSYYAETMFQFVAILFSETTVSNPEHIYVQMLSL
jgi:hypothetical protein